MKPSNDKTLFVYRKFSNANLLISLTVVKNKLGSEERVPTNICVGNRSKKHYIILIHVTTCNSYFLHKKRLE